jgi:mannose-6-phosphate isomerase
MAEMWFGAHPADPSILEDGRGLDDAIAADPVSALGGDVVASFGPRLPFMMKLLAAAEPLSLQVHPDSAQAARGFSRQDADGIDLADPARSYQDPFHKPEMIFALTRFEGMAGFRDTTKSAAILRMFDLDFLDRIADELESDGNSEDALRIVVTRLLAQTSPETVDHLRRLRSAAAEAEARSHRPAARRRPPSVDASSVERESLRVFAQTVKLVDRYPQDAGVLVTLLLNHVVLAPGEAMFIDAGVMHAYTSGFGVEIMAASDNVLRAGLTPKHVDIPGLLEITDFSPIPPPRWKADRTAPHGTVGFAPPVEEFELLLLGLTSRAASVEVDGPCIVVCLQGEVSLACMDGGGLDLQPGQSCFVAAGDGAAEVSGSGRAAVGRLASA